MATPYTSYVKEQYPAMKAKNPDTNSKDILRLIAADWTKNKPPKEDKPKKELKRTEKSPPKPKKKTTPIEITGDNVKDKISNILSDNESPPPSPVSTKRDNKAGKVTEKTNRTTKKKKGVEV